MIQGVLFDMDGLMFDTERIGRDGWQAAARSLGITIPESLIASMRGTGTDQCRAIFNAAIPGALYDTARALRIQYADAWIEQNGVPVKPGLRTLLTWLQTMKIPAVVATSSEREKALAYMRQTHVDHFFAAMVFGPEVQHPKPAPDIFLAAVATIQASPQQCVVLEDSVNGLRAAKAAQCRAIVVPDLSPAPPRTEQLWDACASDLFQVIDLLQNIRQADSFPKT